MLKRLMSIVLSLVLLLSMATVVQAEDGELEILANPPKNHVYTEIVYNMGKTEMTIFGYINEEGTPQFRIYGKVGKTKGFFPVTVSSDGELTVESAEPVKDNKKMFGEAKIASDKMDIPDGFAKTNKKNIFRIENIFGEKEHVAYASYDGENYYYFPIAKNNQPIPGSFPMDIDDMVARSKKTNGNKKYKKPADLKDGFSKGIILLTSDGGELKTYIAGPVLDIDSIKASKGRSFGYGGGHRGGSNSSSSSNSNVKFAQNILKQLGFLNGAVDGKLGDQTKKAISAFQAKNGLVQTGALDKGTLEKLRGNTAINAQGKTVLLRTIEEAKDKAAAQAALNGLKATVSIRYNKLGTNETQTFTVKTTANPNGLSNFTYSLLVQGPEAFSATLNPLGGTVSHSFKTPGEGYRALLYVNGPAGTIGMDFKDFSVLGGTPTIPGTLSQEDAATDRYLQMNFGGSHNQAVAKGSNANIAVNIKPVIPGHTYTIAVSGPGYTDSITGTSYNKSVQSDGTAKDYTVTVTGYFNGAVTKTVTGTFKVLAAGTATPGTEYVNLTYTHTGDVPSGVTNSETVVKGSTINKTTETKLVNGISYTGTWSPSGSFTITEAKTFTCNWVASYPQLTVTLQHTGSVPSGVSSSSVTVPYNSSYTPSYVAPVVNEITNADGSVDRYTYTNNGWSPQSASNITSNMTFTCAWNVSIVQIQPPTPPTP